MKKIGFRGLQQALRINPTAAIGLCSILDSNKISLKAKALALEILIRSSHFNSIQTDKKEALLSLNKEGPDAINSTIKELERAGLLHKTTHRNENGRRYIIGQTWEIDIREGITEI